MKHRLMLNNKYFCNRTIIRGCTGFDGGLEIMLAIHGPGPCKNLENLNINAEDNFALAA